MKEKSPTILIVDDDSIIRQMNAEFVRSLGFSPITAENGADALIKIETEHPDVILLDLEMPVMGGLEVLQRLKEEGKIEALRIIIVSSLEKTDLIARTIQLGADDFLKKPFDPVILKSRIESSLARKRVWDLKDQHREEADRYNIRLEKLVRKRTEDLAVTHENLKEVNKNLRIASQAKDEFLANMSHEIRTPMNAIVGLSHLALKTDLDERQLDYVTKIHLSARNLLGIINDILDFSKIEAGKMELEKTAFSLGDVLDNLFNMIGLKAEEKGLEIVFHTDQDVPWLLLGDPMRLGQVLINLTNNAVKFTHRGEIVVHTEKVDEKEENDDEVELRFSVRDTGIGMSPEELNRLFKAFSQADSSITRKYGGTGLGLTIAKRLAEMMGGRITVRSRKGQGSVFSFTARFQRQEGKQTRGSLQPSEDLKELHVLVVDDNASARRILSYILRSFSFRVTLANSAEEGLTILENATEDDPYRLVLMDWRMPGMDGIEASNRIKEHPRLSRIPAILMVTAYGREEVMKQAEEAGIDAFLIKPVNQQILFDTVMGIFGKGAPATVLNQVDSAGLKVNTQVFAGARILVVEDNLINQQIATELLQGAELNVTLANNGIEALEVLESTEEPFDVVLMDLQMPELDGYETTRRIRARRRFHDLPIIAMTAHAMPKDREKCLAAGMNDHASKPIDPDALFQKLIKWIKPGDRTPVLSRPDRSAEGEEESEEIPFELPGITVSAGLKKVNGNTLLYGRLLRDFEKEFRNVSTELPKKIADQDWDAVTRIAHTIKGVAGNLAMNTVLKTAADLETAGKKGNKKGVIAHFAHFDTALMTVFESIKGLAGETREKAKGGRREVEADGGIEKTRIMLNELILLLEESDYDSEAAVHKLKDRFSEPSRLDLMDRILEAVNQFDFNKGLTLAVSLSENISDTIDA